MPTHITAKLAVKWAQQPASTDANYLAGRLRAVRSFARYRILSDPRTEIPPRTCCRGRRAPSGPISSAKRRSGASWRQACDNGGGANADLRARSRYTIFGLLSVTGMRSVKPSNLDLEDVDLDQGVLTIRNTKFGKSRLVPVHATTLRRPETLPGARNAFLAGRVAEALLHIAARPPDYSHRSGSCVPEVDPEARAAWRLGPHGPRLHDLRHTMAVEVLRRCYSAGADPERRLPALSTYLGHTHLNYTYWYLHQNPALMTEAMARLQHRWEAPA